VYDLLRSRKTLITEKIMVLGSSKILSILCCFRYKFSNFIRLQVNIDFKTFRDCLLICDIHRFPLTFLHLLICNLVSHVLCFKIMSFHKCLQRGNRRRNEFHATKRLKNLDSGYGKWISQLFRGDLQQSCFYIIKSQQVF